MTNLIEKPPATCVHYIGFDGNPYYYRVGSNCDLIKIHTTKPEQGCVISWVTVIRNNQRIWSAPEHKCERLEYGLTQ